MFLTASVRRLYPGYFAAAMATGIVSVGLYVAKVGWLSNAFWAAGVLIYLLLWLLYVLRALRWPSLVRADLTDPSLMFGYFTLSAGSNVLATRCLLGGLYAPALVLGAVGAVVWLALMYFTSSVLVMAEPPTQWRSVNGSWLIATVAVQSSAALAAAAIAPLGHVANLMTLAAFAFWSVGILIYLVFICLIIVRLFFHAVRPSDMQPPYWINMGATAVTALAGSRLLLVPHANAFLQGVRPFVEGFTVMFWAWGTWWIPFLLLIGIWKYVVSHEALRYHPSQWSIVFPLGMYATATLTFARLPGFMIVQTMGTAFLWIAVAAWVVVGAAACVGGARRSEAPHGAPPAADGGTPPGPSRPLPARDPTRASRGGIA